MTDLQEGTGTKVQEEAVWRRRRGTAWRHAATAKEYLETTRVGTGKTRSSLEHWWAGAGDGGACVPATP